MIDRPGRREAAGWHGGNARKRVENYCMRSLCLCCKWGGMALFGLLSDDRCRLRRNQFFACFDPILVERLFSVIPSRRP
jgi:hypothetical protein